jgi:hypothetical protein
MPSIRRWLPSNWRKSQPRGRRGQGLGHLPHLRRLLPRIQLTLDMSSNLLRGGTIRIALMRLDRRHLRMGKNLAAEKTTTRTTRMATSSPMVPKSHHCSMPTWLISKCLLHSPWSDRHRSQELRPLPILRRVEPHHQLPGWKHLGKPHLRGVVHPLQM